MASEVIVGQREHRQLLEAAENAAEALHAVREDAAQVAHAVGDLVVVDRLGADPRQLVEDLGRGLGRDVVAHRGRHQEGAGAAPIDERARGAVGEAVALAQVEIDPAGELAAEDGVDERERAAIGMGPRRTPVSDSQLGLRRARAIDQDHAAPARRRVESRRGRRRRRADRASARSAASSTLAGRHHRPRAASSRAPRAARSRSRRSPRAGSPAATLDRRATLGRRASRRRAPRRTPLPPTRRPGRGDAATRRAGRGAAARPRSRRRRGGAPRRRSARARRRSRARGRAPTPRRSSSRRRSRDCRRATRSPRRSAARSGWWCRPRASRR